MDSKNVGRALVDLCNQGKYRDAVDALYDNDVVSVEAMESPTGTMPRAVNGIDAVRAKGEWWESNNEIHSAAAEGPFPHGADKFAVKFRFDVTAKAGPMAGQRYQMEEIAVYTVKNGRIVREEFFYAM
jgi:ketosteroid isomerase-like protein